MIFRSTLASTRADGRTKIAETRPPAIDANVRTAARNTPAESRSHNYLRVSRSNQRNVLIDVDTGTLSRLCQELSCLLHYKLTPALKKHIQTRRGKITTSFYFESVPVHLLSKETPSATVMKRCIVLVG